MQRCSKTTTTAWCGPQTHSTRPTQALSPTSQIRITPARARICFIVRALVIKVEMALGKVTLHKYKALLVSGRCSHVQSGAPLSGQSLSWSDTEMLWKSFSLEELWECCEVLVTVLRQFLLMSWILTTCQFKGYKNMTVCKYSHSFYNWTSHKIL